MGSSHSCRPSGENSRGRCLFGLPNRRVEGDSHDAASVRGRASANDLLESQHNEIISIFHEVANDAVSSTSGAKVEPDKVRQPQNESGDVLSGSTREGQVELRVRDSVGAERAVKFDERPLSEQVRDLAASFFSISEDDDFVLVKGSGRETESVCSRAQLMSMPQQASLHLRPAREVAHGHLITLRKSLSAKQYGDVRVQLWGLLTVIHAEPNVAEGVIEEDCLRDIFIVGSTSDCKCTELAMACLCQLLRYQEGLAWLECHRDSVTCELFESLLTVIFPSSDENTKDVAQSGVPPQSSLAICLFLLQVLPECAAELHTAALLQTRGGDESGFAYERMISALEGAGYFEALAASSIFSALGNASCNDAALREQVEQIMQACPEGAAALDHISQGGRHQVLMEQVLALSMSSCVQGLVANNFERLGGSHLNIEVGDRVVTSSPWEDDSKSNRLKQEVQRLKLELRQRHTVMCKMVTYLKLEHHPAVEEALPAIVRSGWDSVEWKNNYSLLHYAADCVEDPGIVELVALLASDVEKKDDAGKSALDYAAGNKSCVGVVPVLKRLLQAQKMSRSTEIAIPSKEVALPETDVQDMLRKLGNMSPELRADLEIVLRSSFADVTWPSNFTAFHRAAQCGHVNAMQMLIHAKADPTARDDWDLTPLDYALQSEHLQAQEFLRSCVEAKKQLPSPILEETPEPEPEAGQTIAGPDNAQVISPEEAHLRAALGKFIRRKRVHSVFSAGIDLLKKQARAREQDPDELGLAELRSELKRLKAENAKLHETRQLRLADRSEDATTECKNILGGPLDETALQKYLTQLQAFGREAVFLKLMEPSISGGLAFDETESLQAMNQLDLIQRLALGVTPGKQRHIAEIDTNRCRSSNVAAETRARQTMNSESSAVCSESPQTDGAAKGQPPKAKGKGSKSASGGTKGDKSAGPKGKAPAPKGKGKGKKEASDEKQEPVHVFSKPVVVPCVPMKPLWWKAYVMGKNLQKGETVWDDVEDNMSKVPVDDLVGRFSKNKGTEQETQKKKAAVTNGPMKVLRVITDTQVVVGREAALKKLPASQDIACAIEELNEDVLTLDLLQILQDNACPTDAQLKQLASLREQNPTVPMALPEQYMWVIGQLPAYQQRLDCWAFVRSFGETQQLYMESLELLEPIFDCFSSSKSLPFLLGIVLAVGNYLNGGTNRGQADGFDLETLGKLDSVKDPEGKDLRHFVFNVFINQMEDAARSLIQDLGCCLSNVHRRVSKDADGVEALSKTVRMTLEDIDIAINAVQTDFAAKKDMMHMVLQYIDDPADTFKLQMPQKFSEAMKLVADLVTSRDRVKDKYGKLLSWFKVSGVKSGDFCLLWDNFLIPGDAIMNKPERFRKDVLMPKFCSNKPIDFDDFAMLWDARQPQKIGGVRSSGALPRTSNAARRRAKRAQGKPVPGSKKVSQKAEVLQFQFAQRLMTLAKRRKAAEEAARKQRHSIGTSEAAQKYGRLWASKLKPDQSQNAPLSSENEGHSGRAFVKLKSQDRLVAAGLTPEQ